MPTAAAPDRTPPPVPHQGWPSPTAPVRAVLPPPSPPAVAGSRQPPWRKSADVRRRASGSTPPCGYFPEQPLRCGQSPLNGLARQKLISQVEVDHRVLLNPGLMSPHVQTKQI